MTARRVIVLLPTGEVLRRFGCEGPRLDGAAHLGNADEGTVVDGVVGGDSLGSGNAHQLPGRRTEGARGSRGARDRGDCRDRAVLAVRRGHGQLVAAAPVAPDALEVGERARGLLRQDALGEGEGLEVAEGPRRRVVVDKRGDADGIAVAAAGRGRLRESLATGDGVAAAAVPPDPVGGVGQRAGGLRVFDGRLLTCGGVVDEGITGGVPALPPMNSV